MPIEPNLNRENATVDCDTDVSLQWCDACGSEGYEMERITVYERGCGYGHDDWVLDYSRPCKWCDGTGLALVPVEPIEFDDLAAIAGEYHA